MQVGLSLFFQGRADMTDAEVWQNELPYIDLAEPLGFDSIWSVEHHFSNYTMCPDVVQFLSYAAGRTRNIQLGTMVVVLPWHDPIRVAEQLCVLDIMSGGRVIVGFGRGLGRREFGGFGIDMSEARGRFVEAAEIILETWRTGMTEYDGEFFTQARRPLRPAPARSFDGRIYCAAVSPESRPIMANLGAGLLIIPQKTWEEVGADCADYRRLFAELHGVAPPAPIVCTQVFVDPDPGRAADLGVQYIGAYYRSAIDHYELGGDHFANTPGYENYTARSETVQQADGDVAVKQYVDRQAYGTPDECFEQILAMQEATGTDHFAAVTSYGAMPYDEAERNLRLFASDVMPRLKALPTPTM